MALAEDHGLILLIRAAARRPLMSVKERTSAAGEAGRRR
jgi:hypothetical protein